jgi:hypothetical protein
LADKLIELIEADCNSICPPSQRASEIAALEREIEELRISTRRWWIAPTMV